VGRQHGSENEEIVLGLVTTYHHSQLHTWGIWASSTLNPELCQWVLNTLDAFWPFLGTLYQKISRQGKESSSDKDNEPHIQEEMQER
jgi:hypothetical protein